MRGIDTRLTSRCTPSTLRCVLIAGAALIALALMPATASAAATVTNPFPVPDSTVIGSPYGVSAEVQAGSAILTSTRIAIDGVNVTTYVDWPGHWEDPDCMEVWIVDDYTKATVSASKPEGFSAGTHTAVMTVNTESSGTTTYTWSFTVTYPADQLATFSLMTPSPNTTVTSLPMMRVTIESTNAISGYNADLFVDGALVNHTYNVTNPKKLILFSLAQVQMTDGPHTARATIFDALRIFTEHSWSFNVAVKPTVTVVAPASASTVSVAKPPIRINVTDNTPGPVRIVLKIDGTQVFDGTAPQGAFRWDPTSGFVSGSSHTVRADVYDAAGNTSAITWSFNVQAAPPMSTRNDCTSCHAAAEHPFNNCTQCHQDDPLYDPHGANRYGPVGPCYDCHGSGYTHSISPDCAYCHSSTQWLQIPRHDDAAVDAKHVRANPGCDACHSSSIVDEHGKYPSTSSFKYQCSVCHASARPEVKTAIANNDLACVSCHPSADGHVAVHVSSSTPAGSTCGGCHDANLVGEHVTKRGFTCATCHDAGAAMPTSAYSGAAGPVASASPVGDVDGISLAAMTPSDIASAIANGVTSCGACHVSTVSHVAVHDNPALDPECASCHQSNISAQHGDDCDTCHASTDPDVIAAIAANDLDCLACHTMDAHPAAARNWNYNLDYYSWGATSPSGNATIALIGSNPTNPGVHANYQSTTAKCGICHSVHRANASGVKLLDTATATCAGCHKAGVSTVTNVLVSWQPGGPHGSGVDADCASIGCHLANPHGAGGSKYKIMAAKLVRAEVDAALDATSGPLSNEASSGITVADLNADASSTWDAETRSAVVIGYTCNTAGCHEQTMLTVLRPGWEEERVTIFPSGPTVRKGGHLSSAEATAAHASYAPVTGCTSCHDQTDPATRSGYTFPHSQTAYSSGTSNTGSSRAYLWMTFAGSVGGSSAPMTDTNQKSFDGACLKCHRATGGGSGIGIDH